MSPRRRRTTLVLLVIVVNIFRGDSLTCHPAEYEVNNECCPMCQPGCRVKVDCSQFLTTSCLPCTEGTFSEKSNRFKRCFFCTTCDPGSGLTVKKSCTLTSDTVCEPLEGFLCVDSTKDGCAEAKKHRSCVSGQYIHQRGTAFTDTVCSSCSDGTFSNGSTTTCQQHTKCEDLNLLLITAGTSSADAQCGEPSKAGMIAGLIILVLVVIVILASIVGVLMYKRFHQVIQDVQKTPHSSLQRDHGDTLLVGLKQVLGLRRNRRSLYQAVKQPSEEEGGLGGSPDPRGRFPY